MDFEYAVVVVASTVHSISTGVTDNTLNGTPAGTYWGVPVSLFNTASSNVSDAVPVPLSTYTVKPGEAVIVTPAVS